MLRRQLAGIVTGGRAARLAPAPRIEFWPAAHCEPEVDHISDRKIHSVAAQNSEAPMWCSSRIQRTGIEAKVVVDARAEIDRVAIEPAGVHDSSAEADLVGQVGFVDRVQVDGKHRRRCGQVVIDQRRIAADGMIIAGFLRTIPFEARVVVAVYIELPNERDMPTVLHFYRLAVELELARQ